jgi:hypothetical protein
MKQAQVVSLCLVQNNYTEILIYNRVGHKNQKMICLFDYLLFDYIHIVEREN